MALKSVNMAVRGPNKKSSSATSLVVAALCGALSAVLISHLATPAGDSGSIPLLPRQLSPTPVLSALASLLPHNLRSVVSNASIVVPEPTIASATSAPDGTLTPDTTNLAGTEPLPAYETFACNLTHSYRTTLISVSPLILYLHHFSPAHERAALVARVEAEEGFAASEVTLGGRSQGTPNRTSRSAPLDRSHAEVQCVLARAEAMLSPGLFVKGRDDIGPPQLVRYEKGERFNIHRDWFERFQPVRGADWDERTGLRRRRVWNRVASFFVFLEDQCEGGETHFPFVEPAVLPESLVGQANGEKEQKPLWRRHESGGIAFRPVAGNAVFWVNLFANGTGDLRTRHAGLPLDSGRKTAMNIWPRWFIGPDA